MRLYFLIIFLLVGYYLNAQMVNIEGLRKHEDTTHLSLNANLSFRIQQNDKNRISEFGFDFLGQYNTKSLKDFYFVALNTAYNNTNSINISNSALIHLRYNRLITKVLRFEIFGQIQNNRVLDLRIRNLFGFGPRIAINSDHLYKIYLGALYMAEYEQLYLDASSDATYSRLSAYLALDFSLPKKIGKISSVTYYQPKLDKISDYRFSNHSELSLMLLKRLAFIIQWNYTFDAAPPKDIKSNGFEFKNGIKFIF